MKRHPIQRLIAMLLSMALLVSLVYVPGEVKAQAAQQELDAVQQLLGENWYVNWNGGTAAAADYLSIAEGGSHGNYSLRIGHPTEATNICLRYKLYKTDMGMAATEEMGIGMKFSAKVEGTLSADSWIGVINPVDPATGGNRANLTAEELASIGTEWTAIDKTASDYGVWCYPEYDRAELEFNIVLDAGNYFYLDDLQGYGYWGNTGDMAYVNVVHNGSFERWYCAWNDKSSTTKDADFAQTVEGGRSGNALRLGNAEMATDYTLHLQLAAPQAAAYSFDLWAKAEGTVTTASFELFDGSLSGRVTRYSLAGVGTDWTHVEHAEGLTDVWVDSGTLLIQLYVQLPAGSYLYLDDISIVKGYSTELSNLLCDGGFEGKPMGFDLSDVSWNQVQQKLGENWYVNWNGGELVDADYLSIVEGGSHGNYSLRIGHPTEATDICLRYNLYKTDLGLSATEALALSMKFSAKVEGALKDGSWIGVINPVSNAAGNDRANLTDEEIASISTDWTAIDKSASDYGVWSGSEYDRAILEFNIVLDAGSYFYLDDLCGYGYWGNTGDMAYVNVVHNGSFERWHCTWNASSATAQDAEFAQTVKGGRSGKALRLGNAEMATDYTLQLQLSAPQAAGYSFDLWAKAEGPVTNASFELFDGSLSGAVRRYSLADVGTDWTHIEHTYDTTDVWVSTGTLLVQLYVNLPAGSYLYLDDVSIVKGLSTDLSNMLYDGGFEGESLYFTERTLVPDGVTYYVDSAYGSDEASGTSEEEAWKTLDKVNETVFQPGDEILFKAGSAFVGHLHPGGSGTEGKPITVGMYGTGTKPMIIGNGSEDAVVSLYNQSYWEISDLDISGGNNSDISFGINVIAQDMGQVDHIYIRNNYVHDIAGDLGNKVSGGIFVTVAGTEVKTWYNHVRVENNTVRHADRTGITLDAYTSWENKLLGEDEPGTWVPSTDVVFRGNFVDDIGGDGIVMKNCDGGLVEYNTAKNCNARSSEANVAIWVFNSNNCVMQYNEAYGTRYTHDGQGFDVDSFCENTTVQYNYSHDNEGGFMLVCAPGDDGTGLTGYYTKDTVVRYNISQNDGQAGMMYSGNSYNTHVYNNTIYVSEELDTNIVEVYEWGAVPYDCYFENNLIYNLGSGGYALYSAQIDFSNNLMYGNHPESEPADTGKITADPLLVAPGTGETGRWTLDGYMLKEGSPAIGAGKVIGDPGEQDYFGNAINAATPNIGAYGGSGVADSYEKGEVLPENIAYVYPVYVTAQTGTLPGLPDSVPVHMNDGTDNQAAVTWQNIKVYTQAGVYTVIGYIDTVKVTATVEVTEGLTEVQKLLGKQWFVSWNGSTAADTDFLKIVEDGAHGNYSLRIGHPTEKTNINLNYMLYKSDIGVDAAEALGMGMQFSAKVEGTLQEGSWISMTNPVAYAAGGNRSNISEEALAAIGTDWTAFDETDSFYGVWCGGEYDHARMEFNIVLEPGDYFYLDAIEGYGVSYDEDNRPSLVTSLGGQNLSFEQWYCAWNGYESTTVDTDYVQLVEGGHDGNALRLGSEDKATDYTLHLRLPAPVAGAYSFDLWAKTEGTVKAASFELFDGDLSGAVRRYSLADIGTDWAHVEHAYDTTDVWVNSDTLLVQLYVYLDAGSYLYLDDVAIVNGYSNSLPNMLSDGGFEGQHLACLLPEYGSESGVSQWGLTLGEDIGVTFALTIEDAVLADPDAKLLISVGSGTAVAYGIPESANENGYYEFTVNVAAAQMTEQIKLQLVSSGLYGKAYACTVKDYADYILSSEEYDAKTKALVTAMLSYGGKAQTYFGYRTDALADADITAPAAAEIPGTSGAVLSGSVSGIRFYGATVLFESKTAIRYYFTVTGELGEYLFTDGDGSTYTPEQKGTLYYVEIAGIDPQELDSQMVLQVTKTGSEETLSVSYGCLDYISRMYYKTGSTQALKDLLQSLYDYHLAAKAYIIANA